MIRVMTEKVWVVLKGGHPISAHPDESLAREKAANHIREDYEEQGGYERLGLMPPDDSHLIPWWSNRVFPTRRYCVIPVPWEDLETKIKNAKEKS